MTVHIRDSRDWYATPSWCVYRLYDALPTLSPPTLDPCAGDGALLAAAGQVFGCLDMDGIELHGELVDVAWKRSLPVAHGDGLSQPWYGEHLLMNPPYRDAERWVRKALVESASCAILLRLGFLGSQRRFDLFEEHPPSGLVVLSKRPSFTSNRKTDNSDYAWFVWNNNPEDHRDAGTQLRWVNAERSGRML
jgi:hypothetical protein